MNTERFTGKAELYDSYRPSYPVGMYDYIYENLLKQGNVIADIGSGTGLLSEGFLKRGSRVYGVEPNADMRTAGEKRLKGYADFISVAGTSENTLLDASSVNLVTAASAFHWFDPALFAKECKRIMRAGGSVVLIYNKRDRSSDLVCEIGNTSVLSDKKDDFTDFFDGGYTTKSFENTMSFDLTGFIGNMLSHSAAPLPTDAEYDEYLIKLKSLFDRHAKDGHVIMPYVTHVYHGLPRIY